MSPSWFLKSEFWKVVKKIALKMTIPLFWRCHCALSLRFNSIAPIQSCPPPNDNESGCVLLWNEVGDGRVETYRWMKVVKGGVMCVYRYWQLVISRVDVSVWTKVFLWRSSLGWVLRNCWNLNCLFLRRFHTTFHGWNEANVSTALVPRCSRFLKKAHFWKRKAHWRHFVCPSVCPPSPI